MPTAKQRKKLAPEVLAELETQDAAGGRAGARRCARGGRPWKESLLQDDLGLAGIALERDLPRCGCARPSAVVSGVGERESS